MTGERNHAPHTSHLPFGEEILEMNHLHHDGHILLRGGAEVVLNITLPLELEHHLLNGHTLPADAAELVPEPVSHTLQSILDEGLSLREQRRELSRLRKGKFRVQTPAKTTTKHTLVC